MTVKTDPIEAAVLMILEATTEDTTFTQAEKDYMIRKMTDAMFNDVQALADHCLQVRVLNQGTY